MSSFYPCTDHLPDSAETHCDDCGWLGTISDVEMIQSAQQRLSAGETIPAGECPECGACAYLAEPTDPAPSTLEVINLAQATIERLTCIDPNKRASAQGTLDVIRVAIDKAEGGAS